MFVKLPDPITDTPMYLKVSEIEAIFQDDLGNTEIDTRNSEYVCSESPEEVYQKISAC